MEMFFQRTHSPDPHLTCQFLDSIKTDVSESTSIRRQDHRSIDLNHWLQYDCGVSGGHRENDFHTRRCLVQPVVYLLNGFGTPGLHWLFTPDRSGPGGIVGVAHDVVDMQLGSHIAKRGHVQFFPTENFPDRGTERARFLPECFVVRLRQIDRFADVFPFRHQHKPGVRLIIDQQSKAQWKPPHQGAVPFQIRMKFKTHCIHSKVARSLIGIHSCFIDPWRSRHNRINQLTVCCFEGTNFRIEYKTGLPIFPNRLLTPFMRIVVILIVGLFAGCESGRAPVSESGGTGRTLFGKPIVAVLTANVTRVDDGDTIEVTDDNGDSLTVRLESVDAPEGDEPFSELARQALADLIERRQVQLLSTGKDGQGRTLAFVKRDDLDVNRFLIENGFARHFSRYSQDASLAQLEVAAREKKLNIWADAEPIAPPAAGSNSRLSKLSMLTWNVESDGSDFNVIAEQLKELSGHTIYGLSEVDEKAFDVYRLALGDSFKSIQGTHKHNDFLQLIYDDQQLELLGWNEIDEVGGVQFNRPDRAMRSPLLARFKQRDSEAEFQVVLNHLARGDAQFRQQQAIGLREWGRQQTLPTICIGDFNFDYVFATEKGNDAFVEFMRDNVWKWIQPTEMIDTNWYDGDGDGADDYPGSMLDFAFVAGPAKDLDWNCEVIVRDGDFPDNAETSDHRPVLLTLAAD